VTAGVEVRTLERIVTTRGIAGFDIAESFVAGGSGRVTAVWVAVGSEVQAGTRVLEINGRPTIAVRGRKPMWRDLALGDDGPDVRFLQEALQRSGHLSLEPDGRFGSATTAGLRKWQEDHRFPQPDGAFKVDDWIVGGWPRRVGQVKVTKGSFLGPGSELIVATERDESVSIELTPSDRLRVTRGDSVRVDIAATGSRAEGTVDELDVTPETLEDESVVYFGRVTLEDDLDVPEGTQVRVAIVVDRVEDVLTVPLASLVADMDGRTSIRVVRSDGTVKTVVVNLGLSEGAWVHITSGLTGDETVLVAEE
jgi:multidrug efflux pump subunit AcrA (membrane-fusion protein)